MVQNKINWMWIHFLLGMLMQSSLSNSTPCSNPCYGYSKMTIIQGEECNQYFVCYQYKVVRQQWCIVGTGYDARKKTCTWKAYIECEKKKLIRKKEREGVFVCPGNLQEAFYPNFTSGCPTTRYIKCNSGVQTLLSCPSGTYFNDATSACDVISKITCSADNPQCPQGLSYGVLADYTSGCPPPKYFVCSRYYDESNQDTVNYKTEVKCPDGLYYNEGIKSCDFIQNIPCQHNFKH